MIEHVRIQNFRCFRDVSAPVKPLTVLIGANDTGKSSFQKALYRLFYPSTRTLLDLPFDSTRSTIEYKLLLLGGGFVHVKNEIAYSGGDSFWMNDLYIGDPPEGFRRAAFVQLPSNGPKMVSEGISDQSGANQLGEDGQGLPAFLDYLLRRDRPRFARFIQAMQEQVPGLEDVNIYTPDASHRSLELVIEGGRKIPGDEASAGVRILLFYMALAFHPDPPHLLLVEEPENGIHPRRLKEVIGLLRSMTTGQHTGHPTQVVLTTHSPYLLDFIDPKQDQVLVFRRQEDGNRTVDPMDLDRLHEFLENEFLLGEIWFNQGEDGLVRKVDS